MAYADEVEVTPEWFVPHRSPVDRCPLEGHMVRRWKKYMSYEDHHDCGWSTRIVALLCHIPRACNLRGSRVAVTFAFWVTTANGNEFLRRVFQDIKPRGDKFDRGRVAELWGREAMYSPMFSNPMEGLMRDDQGKPVYSDPPYPTLEDYRVVENTLIFFLSDEGRALIKSVYRAAKEKCFF